MYIQRLYILFYCIYYYNYWNKFNRKIILIFIYYILLNVYQIIFIVIKQLNICFIQVFKFIIFLVDMKVFNIKKYSFIIIIVNFVDY